MGDGFNHSGSEVPLPARSLQDVLQQTNSEDGVLKHSYTEEGFFVLARQGKRKLAWARSSSRSRSRCAPRRSLRVMMPTSRCGASRETTGNRPTSWFTM